jgi:flagellar biosynthesis component FlhA
MSWTRLIEFSPSAGALSVVLLSAIALLLVELPPWLLDILLVSNIVMALTLLLRGLFLDRPSSLYSFPTILVLATLFRLTLNVSSTKLILLRGDSGLDSAGEVIRSFGSAVTGGDPVVGAIVFTIIAVVNFVVIAKGSARVAEVSARFALDAMPGKQLAIDAEQRAGSLSAVEGAAKRTDLNRESQFFGSMDGAMKWVQGDAMAGLVITFVNVIGGVSLGISRGLGFSESLETFGILTIGDGLVSIIPSLLISVAAGIIVSRVEGKDDIGAADELLVQVFSDPRAAFVAGGASLVFAIFGLFGILSVPPLPFFFVGAVVLSLLFVYRRQFEDELIAKETIPVLVESDNILRLSSPHNSVEDIVLEVDRAILGNYLGLLGDEGAGSRFQQFIKIFDDLRERVLKEKGIPLPALSVRINPRLVRSEYRIFVREQEVRGGVCNLDHMMVAAASGTLESIGFNVLSHSEHPLHGGSISWIINKPGGYSSLKHLGIESYNVAQFLALEASASALGIVEEILGVEECKMLLSRTEGVRKLSDDLFSENQISYSEFTELLRRLAREGVSIRDVRLIIGGVLEFISLHPQPEDRQEWLGNLHSHLRKVLARTIVHSSMGPGDRMRAFLLSGEIEDEFRAASRLWDGNRSRPPLEPEFEVQLRESASQIFGPVIERGALPVVVLCPDEIRPAVQEFFIHNIGNSELVRALAFEELGSRVSPDAIGVVTIAD